MSPPYHFYWCEYLLHKTGSQVQVILEELRSSLDAIPRVTPPQAKSWAERREQVEQSWESHRAKIFEDVVTSMTLSTEMVYTYVLCVPLLEKDSWLRDIVMLIKSNS